MKKRFLLALLFFCLGKTWALPVGNPAEASLFCDDAACCCPNSLFSLDSICWRVGFWGDFVFNRNFETVTGSKIDFSQRFTNAGYLAVNFCNVVDLFTTLGATKFRFNTSLGPFNAGNRSPRFDFQSSTAFSWSIGGRATLYRCKCLALGVEGQYFSSWPMARLLFVRANVDAYPDESSQRKYTEWQIGTGISYFYNRYFVPYFAVKYSHAFWNFNNQAFSVTGTSAVLPSFRNRKNWGYAVGTTFIPCTCERLAVTVEGRFGDEAAFHVNSQVRF